MVNRACKRIDVANKATWDKMDSSSSAHLARC
jgi:hypothetical protein